MAEDQKATDAKSMRRARAIAMPVSIAVISAVVGSLSSVWAANRFSSADEERTFLLATSARDRAEAAFERASEATDQTAVRVVVKTEPALEIADKYYTLQNWEKAWPAYEYVITRLKKECAVFSQEFCRLRTLVSLESTPQFRDLLREIRRREEKAIAEWLRP
jgi:glutathione synthase/RimK-type ligase-like ATP-grasp enzyme